MGAEIVSKIEDAVCEKIQQRAAFGLTKYGVSLERTDLTLDQWLCHAQEEAMDLICYLERVRVFLAEQKLNSEIGLLVFPTSEANCNEETSEIS